MPDTFIKIASVTVGSGGASSIDFTSIPSTYTDLVVMGSTRDTSDSYVEMQLNGDTNSANYSCRFVRGNGTNAASSSGSYNRVGVSPSTSYTASTFGNFALYIPNYAGSTQKSSSADGVSENNATFATAALFANLWTGTAAINAVKIYPSSGTFVQYSTATLYGIKNS